ncbi:MAG TPA: amino acid adenylation domain-containing protein [Puia sp.]|nr:amino acid adenylation domain-containing protein [Puia sp.]
MAESVEVKYVNAGFSPGKTIVDLFTEQVNKTPDHIAVVFEDKMLTYRELDEHTNQLAHYLRDREVKEEVLVPICMNRSIEMIIGIFGILKAGGAYVPIDPEYPEGRIKYILSDTGAKIILSDSPDKVLRASTGIAVKIVNPQTDWSNIRVAPKTKPAIKLSAHNLAYVIYTSGSTGVPKGVMIEHNSLLHYLLNKKVKYINGDHNKAGNYFSLSYTFDGSITGLFLPLIFGKSIVLREADAVEIFGKSFLENAPYDFIKLTPAHMPLLQMAVKGKLENITKRLVLGGEALHWGHIKYITEEGSSVEIVNEYGPTEATVGCCIYSFNTGSADKMDSIPIGKPLDNVDLYIVDLNNQLVAAGEVGELCIGGPQLARGYLNNPELTAEKFVTNPFSSVPGAKMYKTGDIVRLLADGNIEYLRREDDQVKIRGYRIELGEIENVLLQCPNVAQGVVIAKQDKFGEKNLVAYVVPKGEFDKTLINRFLELRLPEFMVPRLVVPIKAMPLTINGKIDKKLLPDLDASEILAKEFVAARNKTETEVAAIWKNLLQVKNVGVNDNFFELGGNSILAIKTVALLKELNYDLPVIKLYQYPTVNGVSAYLDNRVSNKISNRKKKVTSPGSGDVAVIGMAGRFPGANTIDELWQLLKEGKETISFFTKEELSHYIPPEIRNDSDYVAARGVIDEAEYFDAGFFKISPKIATVMDPQHRVFLQLAWEAFENAGCIPELYDGTIGVFAGSGNNTYFFNNVQGHYDLITTIGLFNVQILNEKDYIATRTAYELNLKGPAVSVHSACSTSLLAIAEAVESIRNCQCDVALAGGAAITSPIKSGHIYQPGAMLSRDGHCRSFDADADGTVFSDGAGVVLLKRKEDAERDGDFIYAVIKGVGVNNDGGGKGSFTAPSSEGQAGAISMALEDASVLPSSISYVETHGTATPLGDPIEIEGLNIAFGTQDKKQYCAIGSVKSNMGHLTAAAGVVGFIKTVLSIYYKQIPPSINYKKPNPNIDFSNSPFFVNTKLQDWNTNGKRRAGVSSFGVGGTNVHVIVEECERKNIEVSSSRPVQFINWSAKTTASREAYAKKLANGIQSDPNINLADVAYTLQTSRQNFNCRRFVIVADKSELVEKLNASFISPNESNQLKESLDEVVFSFPGQGSQYVNMGIDLYQHEPVFKNAVDECAEILKTILNEDIRNIIYPSVTNAEAEEKINNTYYTQPAIFVIEYAVAKLWMSWGVHPSAFIGHSIGEYVAAHLAGVFSLEDGLKMIAIRGKMMSEMPRGSMLAVRSEFDKIESLLSDDLSLAVVNSPGSCVVAGPTNSIEVLSKKLAEEAISNKVLATSHAFHSIMMDPIVAPFEEIVKTVKLSLPRIPIVSTVTGNWMSDADATNPSYWAGHLRSTVRFADAVDTLLKDEGRMILETGPKNVTSSLIRQQGKKNTVAISSLDSTDGQSEYYSVLKAVGQLWLNGLEMDWEGFYAAEKRRKIQLPTYAFEKTRLWLDPPSVLVEHTLQNNNQVIPANTETISAQEMMDNSVPQNNIMRKEQLIERIKEVLENASGIEMSDITPDMNFIEMGFDSLLLTQVAMNLKKEFKLPITFRQLNEEYSTLDLLAGFLDANLPQEQVRLSAPLPAQQPIISVPNQQPMSNTPVQQFSQVNATAIGLISQQIQLLAQQIALLQGGVAPGNNVYAPPIPTTSQNGLAAPNSAFSKKPAEPDVSAEELIELKKPFGATAKIEKQSQQLTTKQQAFISNLIKRYNAKTNASKEYTQKHRAYMADPRVVSGFRPSTKELVYSIVIKKSKGIYLWDLDDNKYIDALNGFGSNFLGYQPEVITNAIKEQIEKGYEIGPQHELAGPVSKLICEFTGLERAALCNTGSEAVLGAMRIARTVTGRSIIVAFSGSYHGIVDEVIVRGTKKLKSFPAASGIMPEAVQNMLILEYGTDESLQIIKEKANEIAAVLVEPVQSRRPEFQPVEFLRKLRDITAQSGTALVFDEVITGFRMHPGGAQALFGIKADIGTYGKVVGAGISIGIIAGKKRFMDALDGGYWQYGDASTPEAGVTYFAGTFVRHPLALAAAKASLEYMKERGPGLQEGINTKAKKLADTVNMICSKNNLPLFVAQFGSLWKIKFKEDIPYSELLFVLMREKGIHILDGFPCFMTEAHSAAEIDAIITAFEESVNEMTEAGFFPLAKSSARVTNQTSSFNEAPIPGARLGKDKDGNPAWFISDPERPGKYVQIK